MIRLQEMLKEGVWVFIGQLGVALGTLAGVRILTEFILPEIFGALMLLIGVTALIMGTTVSPVMQAAIKYFPEFDKDSPQKFRKTIVSSLLRRLGIALCISCIVLVTASRFFTIDPLLVFLCALMLVVDTSRTLETDLLNAARRHRAYATVVVAEAWVRPLAAVAFIMFFGASLKAVLIAYILATAAILLLFYNLTEPVGTGARLTQLQPDVRLQKGITKYSLPLIPMAALGWINGVGDRYLIGSLLSLADAGIYGAVYGLLSRPFQMLSGIIELTLRPHYYKLVAQQKHPEAARLFRKWLVIVLLSVSAALLLVFLFDDLIITILLAERYRVGVNLMVWIGSGYALLAISDVFIKICYAYGYTRRILLVQVLGALLSVILSTAGIMMYGLVGAAMAVPIYFGMILTITIAVSRHRKTLIENSRED